MHLIFVKPLGMHLEDDQRLCMLSFALEVLKCSSCHGKWFNDEVSGVFPDVVPLKTQEVGVSETSRPNSCSRAQRNQMQCNASGADCYNVLSWLLFH